MIKIYKLKSGYYMLCCGTLFSLESGIGGRRIASGITHEGLMASPLGAILVGNNLKRKQL